MKRLFLGFAAVTVVLSAVLSGLIFDRENVAKVFAMDGQFDETIITSGSDNLDFDCKSAYLIDYNSATVIFEKNADERYPIASMCKIMTLLLTFEAIDSGDVFFETPIVISQNASSMGGSQAFLEANNSYIVSDLIKSIVIASANDSSVALAETIKGSENAFVDRMNERAKELCMDNTLFANCTGLPKPSQYSSAKDVSIMTRELLKHKEYYNYSTIWMDKMNHAKGRVTELTNTNKLVKFYNGCDSGKTGYTTEAKHCLSASAMRDGTRLVATVIGANDSKTRFAGVSSMFNYGFSNYKNVLIIDKAKVLSSILVTSGKEKQINLVCENDYNIFSKKGEEKLYQINYEIPEVIKAPITAGDIVGKALIIKDNKVIGEVNVITETSIARKTYFDNLKEIVHGW